MHIIAYAFAYGCLCIWLLYSIPFYHIVTAVPAGASDYNGTTAALDVKSRLITVQVVKGLAIAEPTHSSQL